jgi:NADH:ubiquinone oxidoreductase subunit 6 (subunit J)
MKWNPFLNAGLAVAYIGAVSVFLRFIESIRHDTPDSWIDGVGIMSLFVFSAAVMAFLFFYQPVSLLVENKRTEAVSYFLQTLALFGAVTVTVLTLASLQ